MVLADGENLSQSQITGYVLPGNRLDVFPGESVLHPALMGFSVSPKNYHIFISYAFQQISHMCKPAHFTPRRGATGGRGSVASA
jgi:hypothetical protein